MFNRMLSTKDLTYLILAGGLGTRLQPILKNRPKVLAETRNRPFLFFILDLIKCIGGKNIIVCTGYKAEEVENCIAKQYGNCFNLTFSRETKPLGTGGALSLGAKHIKSEYVVVFNGDSYIKFDLNKYFDWFFLGQYKAALLLAKVRDVDRFGKVSLGEDGKITQFIEKGFIGGEGLINAGIYIFKKSILSRMPKQIPLSLEKDFFPKLVGSILYGFVSDGDFLDIGTPDSYEKVDNFLKDL